MFKQKRLSPLVYSSIGIVLVLLLIRFMPSMLEAMLTTRGYAPHGFCILWDRQLLWLHVITDVLIGLAYVIIAFTLTYLVHRARRDIPFHWIPLAFGLFIVTCGGTHFMSAWTFWTPVYWLEGNVKLITAAASVATAVAFPPLVPRMLSLVQAAKISQERKQQLEQANSELETLYAKIIEVNELKTRFFANVSHELRTPLTLILGSTERLLSTTDISTEQRQTLALVDRNARMLLTQVNDLLDISRLEAGKMELTYTTVDLGQLVESTAANFDLLSLEKEVTFTVETPASIFAQVDVEKVQRILLNLLANAFKFTPAGGAVRCELQTDSEKATIIVTDNGPGVPTELRMAIFERFRQGDGGATRRFGGTGLGLAIAKEFVDLHGGTISVDTAPQGGARFRVELPLNPPPGSTIVTTLDEAALLPAAPIPVLNGLSAQAEPAVITPAQHMETDTEHDAALILVVEDNPDMRSFICEALAGQYRTATAADGNEGLAQALALKPDLILSDIMMPALSGDQLVAAVRTHAELAAIPVVLLTARADDQLRVQMLLTGAQDYLIKPFSVAELHARLGNLIAMKRTRELLQRELDSQSQDVATLAQEVTLRKRDLELALKQLHEQAAEKSRLYDEVRDALRLRDEFLAIASHELKTPLTSLLGIAQLLARRTLEQDSLNERDRRAIRIIFEQGLRLNQMIEMLFDLARMDRGDFVINLGPVDLPALLRDVVEAVRPVQEQHTLELFTPPGTLIVAGDTLRLEQVFHNLISNAIKYSPNGGVVQVEVAEVDGLARVVVIDHGMGIPADSLPQLFQRFYRAPNITYRHISGMGVGLYIVQEIIRHHGGRVEVMSTEGEGSTFTVWLPLQPAAAYIPVTTDQFRQSARDS